MKRVLGTPRASRWRIILECLVVFIPAIVFLALGVAFASYSRAKIGDPEQYLAPAQRPLAQRGAKIQLILGGCAGGIIGGAFGYIEIRTARWAGKRRRWRWVLEGGLLGISLLCIEGLPKPEYLYFIPLSPIIVVWSPFRIAYVPGFMLGYGMFLFVVATKMVLESMRQR